MTKGGALLSAREKKKGKRVFTKDHHDDNKKKVKWPSLGEKGGTSIWETFSEKERRACQFLGEGFPGLILLSLPGCPKVNKGKKRGGGFSMHMNLHINRKREEWYDANIRRTWTGGRKRKGFSNRPNKKRGKESLKGPAEGRGPSTFSEEKGRKYAAIVSSKKPPPT